MCMRTDPGQPGFGGFSESHSPSSQAPHSGQSRIKMREWIFNDDSSQFYLCSRKALKQTDKKMCDCAANDIVQEIKRIHLEKALNQQDLNLKT